MTDLEIYSQILKSGPDLTSSPKRPIKKCTQRKQTAQVQAPLQKKGPEGHKAAENIPKTQSTEQTRPTVYSHREREGRRGEGRKMGKDKEL